MMRRLNSTSSLILEKFIFFSSSSYLLLPSLLSLSSSFPSTSLYFFFHFPPSMYLFLSPFYLQPFLLFLFSVFLSSVFLSFSLSIFPHSSYFLPPFFSLEINSLSFPNNPHHFWADESNASLILLLERRHREGLHHIQPGTRTHRL